MICLCLLIAIFIIRFLVVYLYEPGCLDFEEDYGILRDLDLSDSMDISDNCIFRKVVTTAVYMIPFGLSWYFLIFVPCNWSKLKVDSSAIPQEESKYIGTLLKKAAQFDLKYQQTNHVWKWLTLFSKYTVFNRKTNIKINCITVTVYWFNLTNFW